jgi:flagellar M-ring protein FliF
MEWRATLATVVAFVKGLPLLFWAVAGVIGVSLAVVAVLEAQGPPYVVLDEGLSPEDGGKIIAQLQKLGIPYQLQAAGNVIEVPAPQLAQARLQLGASQTPGGDAGAAWAKVEDAPMTASDLAQSTLAQQALEVSLQGSIESLAGIRAAQVYLAIPPQTPFLADQPRPTASVVIQAADGDAQGDGAAIAALVAGAVPGLSGRDVTVETTSGITVYPAGDKMAMSTQFATVAQVEARAQARIAGLLIPLVGADNFQTNVSANLDFTQTRTHQISYGPAHVVSHETESLSDHYGQTMAALGIPGALSNEPPAATAAVLPGGDAGATAGGAVGAAVGAASGAASGAGGAANANAATGTGATGSPNAAAVAAAKMPEQTSHTTDATYVTDQSDSDITAPDWQVKSIAVSVILNKGALGNVTAAQVQAAIAGAFAYPAVKVNVLAANFAPPAASAQPVLHLTSLAPVTAGLLELLAAMALLLGLALPFGRRLATINIATFLPPPPPRPIPQVLPPRDFTSLRDQAAENVPGVARLLQAWAEDAE